MLHRWIAGEATADAVAADVADAADAAAAAHAVADAGAAGTSVGGRFELTTRFAARHKTRKTNN